MKFTITTPTEVNIQSVLISIPVNYEDEDIPYDFPLRRGDLWEALVNIETGKINNWPVGKAEGLYMKVVDGGTYILLDELDKEISRLDDYVPHGLIPGDYGDYIDLEINDLGFITNWPAPHQITLGEFFKNN